MSVESSSSSVTNTPEKSHPAPIEESQKSITLSRSRDRKELSYMIEAPLIGGLIGLTTAIPIGGLLVAINSENRHIALPLVLGVTAVSAAWAFAAEARKRI